MLRPVRLIVAAGLLAVLGAPGMAAEPTAAADAEFAEAVAGLAEGSLGGRAAAAQRLAAIDHPRVAEVLDALGAGTLYQRRSDDRVVFAERDGRDYLLVDAVTGEALEPAGRREVSRIATNNALRAELELIVARNRLDHPDPGQRVAALRALIDDPSPASLAVVRERLPSEPDAAVRATMRTVLALDALDGDEPAARLEAVATLHGNVNQSVRNRLRQLAADEDVPEALRRDAGAALAASDRTLARYRAVETVFFGLSLGSVLVLAAIGLAITFGVMGVINMAHGELIMIGAYTTYVVQQLMPAHIGVSLAVAVPAAFLITGAVGILIERGVIRFLYGRPLETLLATFGISLLLQQTVRSIFSPLNRAVSTPEWMSGSWEVVEGLTFTYNRLYILLFCLAVFAALLTLLKRTRLGLEVRAVAQNRAMARAMGVRSEWVDALTFGLGAGVAGIAGVALSQLTNVGPNLGQSYIVDSFLVVVFGGVGNLWGTLVAGLSLGVVNKFLEPVAGAVLAKIIVLVFIILFIQKRPRGLFPQRGRAADG